MFRDEREVRMNALRNREKVNDVDHWMKGFFKAIGTLIEEDGNKHGFLFLKEPIILQFCNTSKW